ncbi:MAG: extracellular solute-binding protein [Ruminiclostridium sp.]|nr:extracellular solute-binding protein [Ruminiclostridium sp.]
MFKKVLCLIAAVLLVIGTAACKKNKEVDPSVPSMKYVEEEFGAVKDIIQPGSMQVNSQNQLVIQNIPGSAGEEVNSQELNTATEKHEFLVLGADGKLKNRIACELKGQVSTFTLDSQDNLYIVTGTPDESGINQQLHIADPNGIVKQTIELGVLSYTDQEDYKKTITGIAVDKEGNIYLSRMIDNVLMLDKEGKEKGTLGEAMYMGTVQTDADNNVLLYGSQISDYQNVLQKFNPTTSENLWTTPFEPRREEGVYTGEISAIRCDSNDRSIYLLTGDGVEKFDTSGKHTGKALDFKEHTILASGLQARDFVIDSEKTIWLLASESQMNSMVAEDAAQGEAAEFSLYQYSLKQVSNTDTVPLTLSVPSSNRMIDVAVSSFNKENPGYRITVEQVGDTKRKGKYDEQYINTLGTELMSGLGPDILSVEGLPYEKYAEKGMLVDLSQMMEEDKTFKNNNYYTNLFDAMKQDGKLFVMPVNVSGIAMLSNKKLLSEKKVSFDPANWTWESFHTMTAHSSDGSGVYIVPPDTANIILMGAYQRFIDVKNKKASFDTGEFEKMLEMAKGFGMNTEKMSSDGISSLIETAARGRVMFSPQVIGEFMMLSASKVALDGEFGVHNMPDESQRGGSFKCNEVFAINGSTKYREQAWDFIKILLSDEIQSLDELKGFPVSKKALRDKADKNNKLLTTPGMGFSVSTGSVEPITPIALSEDEISQLLDYVDGLATCCHMDQKILGMIQTETGSYFSGEKSASDVAKTLQQKVSLYLGE